MSDPTLVHVTMVYNPSDPETGADGFMIATGAYTDAALADAERLRLINEVLAENTATTESDLSENIFVLSTELDPDTSGEVQEESDG